MLETRVVKSRYSRLYFEGASLLYKSTDRLVGMYDESGFVYEEDSCIVIKIMEIVFQI